MRAAGSLVVACVLAVTACTGEEPADQPAAPAEFETVTRGTLTACVAPTPALAEQVDGDWQGYDVGVLDAVAAHLALELELVATTFDELVSGVALNGGTCDVGAGGVVDHAALEAVVRTSTGYRTVHRLVVTTTATPGQVEPEEVDGTVAVLDDGPAAAQAGALTAADVVPYPSAADLRRALAEGVVDAGLVTAMERAELEEDLGQPLHVRARVMTDEETVLLLPLGATDAAVEAIDGALAAARDAGHLAALADQWLGA